MSKTDHALSRSAERAGIFSAPRKFRFAREFVKFFHKLDYGHAKDIAKTVIQSVFRMPKSTRCTLSTTNSNPQFSSASSWKNCLPLEPRRSGSDSEPQLEYIFEQPPQEIFNRLLPRYVEMQIYRALLESAASEHGARMAAMDTASRNAGEMIESLTLNMNRMRQAAITREIIEVVSGAGAL